MIWLIWYHSPQVLSSGHTLPLFNCLSLFFWQHIRVEFLSVSDNSGNTCKVKVTKELVRIYLINQQAHNILPAPTDNFAASPFSLLPGATEVAHYELHDVCPLGEVAVEVVIFHRKNYCIVIPELECFFISLCFTPFIALFSLNTVHSLALFGSTTKCTEELVFLSLCAINSHNCKLVNYLPRLYFVKWH